MVYKVLSIITWILLPFVLFCGAACMVYTIASPMVQERVDQIRQAVDGAVSSAAESLNVSWDGDLGFSGGAGGFLDGLIGTAGISGEDVANAFGYASSMATGTASSAEQFGDPAQGQAYLAWRSVIESPIDRVLAGSGIDSDVLVGAAGGSSSASDILASLDYAVLDAISANASSYTMAVTQLAMPSNMPADAQTQMNAAKSAALNYSAHVQTLVSAVRSLKAGNVFALGDVSEAAGAANSSLMQLDASLQGAEMALGVW